jgi:hypothetical protein
LQLSVSLLIANALGIAVLVFASYNNYPGGAALWKLHEQERFEVASSHSRSNPALVHIDVAAAQQVRVMFFFPFVALTVAFFLTMCCKGISRFWQLDLNSDKDQHWSYSKQENITDFSAFHYCISEAPSLPGFYKIAAANGFHPRMLYSNIVRCSPCSRLVLRAAAV